MAETLKLTTLDRDAGQADLPHAAGDGEIPPHKVRFVEFFGLPGIGKTTVSRILVEKLRDAGVAVAHAKTAGEHGTFVSRQFHRFGRVAPKLMNKEDRGLLMRIARFVAEGGQVSAIDLIRRTWDLGSVVAFMLEKRSNGDAITVMDQGVLQGLWSILLTAKGGRTSETWTGILSAVAPEDIIFVYLHGGTATAKARLEKRGDRASRLQRQESAKEDALWSEAGELCHQMANDMVKSALISKPMGQLTTVYVDPSETPEEVAEKACAAVLRALGKRNKQVLAAKS